jgi:hypothetical protein
MFPVFLTGPTAGISVVGIVASPCCAPTARTFKTAELSAAAVSGSLSNPALCMPQGSTGVFIARHPA